MPTISGTFTIPSSQPTAAGKYTNLKAWLYSRSGGVDTKIDEADVLTDKRFSFSPSDGSLEYRVKLVNVNSGNTILASTPYKKELPRTFAPSSSLDCYIYDAALALIAKSATSKMEFAERIVQGLINNSFISDGELPMKLNQETLADSAGVIRTLNVAAAAYALGYYLEVGGSVPDECDMKEALFALLEFLLDKRDYADHHGLLTAGALLNNAASQEDNVNTVDNIMAWYAFKQAGMVLNSTFTAVADELEATIMNQLYHAPIPFQQVFLAKFYQGIYSGTKSTDDNLETTVMGALFLADNNEITKANILLTRAESRFSVVKDSVTGYKPTTGSTSLWIEGSLGMALAYYKTGQYDKHKQIVSRMYGLADATDGGLKWGLVRDNTWIVSNSKSVASTAMGIIAKKNPATPFSTRSGSPGTDSCGLMFLNAELSDTFTKEGCSGGQVGSQHVYKVPAGKHRAATQEAADALAQADLEANGQTYANNIGTCTTPATVGNVQKTYPTQRNNCSPGYTGSVVNYVVEADTYFGTDQEEADALADADAAANAQNYANTNGTCSLSNSNVTFQASRRQSATTQEYDLYVRFRASTAVNTDLVISFKVEYAPSNIIYNRTIPMAQGSIWTQELNVGGFEGDEGILATITITNITPNTSGTQTYMYP